MKQNENEYTFLLSFQKKKSNNEKNDNVLMITTKDK